MTALWRFETWIVSTKTEIFLKGEVVEYADVLPGPKMEVCNGF